MEQNTKDADFQQRVVEANKYLGVRCLTEEEILLLAADAILHSYTYAEKGYG